MWRRLSTIPFFRRLGRALSGVDDAQFGRPAPQDPPVGTPEQPADDGHHITQDPPPDR